MCIIIEREPMFEIPFEKFKTAVLNNPDGYGISFPDVKGLKVLRSPEEPDAEKLYRLINEELIDQKLLIHLRYTTVGETNLRNSHPFPILDYKNDGVSLRMAHNGTIHKYKPDYKSPESDTRMFVREFVRPLFKRFIKVLPPEELLEDPFTKKLLQDQVPSSSVLSFLDSDGNSLIVNPEGNGGKKEEGWYYSNSYSFDPKHRIPSATVNYPKPYQYGSSTTYKDYNTPKYTDIHKITTDDLVNLSDEVIDETLKYPMQSKYLIKELMKELKSAKDKELKCSSQLRKLKGSIQ